MIAEAFAAVLFDGSHPRDPALARWLGIGHNALSGASVDQRSVLGLSSIYRGVNILCNAVAKCTPRIYERLDGGNGGDKRLAREHPAWRVVVNQANFWMSAADLRDTLTAYAILRGNGIAEIARDGYGVPIGFTPLLPDRTGMAVFNSKLGEDDAIPPATETMYFTMVGGTMRTILPENILHIRGRTNNGVWGLDILDVMRETLGLAIAARDCGARFFGQGMMASGVLYMPPGLSNGPKGEETVKNFEAAVRKNAEGLGKSHRMLILEDGAKFEKLSVDPNTAQAIQTREFSILELANIVGIQPHKIGDTKRTSYASLEQSNQEHLDDDIDPWLRRWEEALSRTSLREIELESDTHFIQCNRKALLRTNLAARSAHYASGRQWGYYSVNDVRRAEDMEPIGPDGDVYLIPVNMVPADQANQLRGVDTTPADQLQPNGAAVRAWKIAEGVAYHESTRLIKRTVDEAYHKAVKGSKAFCEFLDSLDKWTCEPEAIKPVLQEVCRFLKESLNKFTEPPYTTADFAQAIANAGDELKQAAGEAALEAIEQHFSKLRAE